MTTFAAKKKLLEAVNSQVTVKKELAKNSEKLVEKQTDQMSEGYNAKGSKIGRYRSKEYADLKSDMNSKPGRGFVDLKLTGSFYEAVTVDIGSTEIEFTSTDSKTTDLEAKYGKEIFGLNENSHNEFINDFEPELIDAFKKEMRL